MPIAVCPVESYKLTVLTEHDAALIELHYQPAQDAALTWTPKLVLHRTELRSLAGALLRAAEQLDAIARDEDGGPRH